MHSNMLIVVEKKLSLSLLYIESSLRSKGSRDGHQMLPLFLNKATFLLTKPWKPNDQIHKHSLAMYGTAQR